MSLTSIQIETKIQELLEGVLPAEQWPVLREELLNSEEARAYYCMHVKMHTLLSLRSERIQFNKLREPIIPVDKILQIQRKKSLGYAAMSAAAILMIAIVAMWMVFVPEVPPTLTFESSPGTQFAVTHDGDSSIPVGKALEVGSRLQLSQGSVELNFGSGVHAIIQAPADITLHDKNELYMSEGTAWFHVPKQAVGFVVKSKDVEIVDLGTEFGVIAKPNGHDEVHVFKGKVQVTSLHVRKEVAALTAGDSRRIDPIGRLSKITSRPSSFLTALPNSLLHFHWAFDNEGEKAMTIQGNHPQINEIKTRLNQSNKDKTFSSPAGRFGHALRFPDAQSYIGTNWPGIGGNASRTVSYWIKLEDRKDYIHQVVGWGGFMGKDDWSSTSQFYSFIETGGRDKTIVGVSLGAHWLLGTTPVADDKWHHIAYTYSGHSKVNGDPDIHLYIDGQLEKTTSRSAPKVPVNKQGNIDVNTDTIGGTVPLIIFGDSWGTNWNNRGQDITPLLDELFIFQAALSNRQIRNLYLHNDYRDTSP